MPIYCIKPEDSDERFYGSSYKEIAKKNNLVKIGNHYFTQVGTKTGAIKEEKKEEEDKTASKGFMANKK